MIWRSIWRTSGGSWLGEVRTYQTEKRYLHQDGHVVWALSSVSAVHDEEDEPLYFVSQIQDVSERKKVGK